MFILLAAATGLEIRGTEDLISKNNDILKNHEVLTLITGVGGTSTAHALTRQLYTRRPDCIIQAGIAGSFKPEFSPGTVALVAEEAFADLGAVDEGRLADVFDLGLIDINHPPFTNKILVNPGINHWKRFRLPFVRGVSVNGISSSAWQVDAITRKYDPVFESMEGAALHYVCLLENIPFIQLRAVSNYVGDRNKSNWKMKEAIKNLNEQLMGILSELPGKGW